MNQDKEEKDFEDIIDNVIKYASNPSAQKTSLKAALMLYYSMGHRNGYNEAMADTKAGRDQRVAVHLN